MHFVSLWVYRVLLFAKIIYATLKGLLVSYGSLAFGGLLFIGILAPCSTVKSFVLGFFLGAF